ncbi:MAG: DUF4430 domain-containing protein [Clostridia bacterium]|nr:DUF4430 domain-containing protein [Clostridia bacterium]
MQKTDLRKILSSILCIVLIAAMALLTTGCQDTNITPDAETSTNEEVSQEPVSATDKTVLGEGENSFIFTVIGYDSAESVFEIHTNETTVGQALLKLGLIEGEEGPYGLYVKTVNGITADYDTDGKYWAFYMNGEYAATGVDATEITNGATYSFKVE